MNSCISNYFSDIEDRRINCKKLHSLFDILILTICAMLSGADGYEYEAIEDFGRNKKSWLKTFLPLENDIPSHDCIRYVPDQITPQTITICIYCMGHWNVKTHSCKLLLGKLS